MIKKCLKCGNDIEVNENDIYVKCNNCKTKYLVEEDPMKKGSINLVAQLNKRVFVIPICIFIILIVLIVVLSIKKANNLKSEYIKKNKSNNLTSINDLDKDDRKKIEADSLVEINNWNRTDGELILVGHKHLGYYLLQSNNTSTLYDVYELTYVIDNSSYTIVTGVEYDNMVNKNTISYNSSQVKGITLTKGNKNLWGYDSQEDLYNDIESTFNGKISASPNIYHG